MAKISYLFTSIRDSFWNCSTGGPALQTPPTLGTMVTASFDVVHVEWVAFNSSFVSRLAGNAGPLHRGTPLEFVAPSRRTNITSAPEGRRYRFRYRYVKAPFETRL
jgi:hypothetical protein